MYRDFFFYLRKGKKENAILWIINCNDIAREGGGGLFASSSCGLCTLGKMFEMHKIYTCFNAKVEVLLYFININFSFI